jgi:hypothetical protein
MTSREQLFPEHDKLKAISGQSQTCGEFLEWLRDEHAEDWGFVRVQTLLAEFFEIDEAVLEEEKQTMLGAQRFLNEVKP